MVTGPMISSGTPVSTPSEVTANLYEGFTIGFLKESCSSAVNSLTMAECPARGSKALSEIFSILFVRLMVLFFTSVFWFVVMRSRGFVSAGSSGVSFAISGVTCGTLSALFW